REEELERGRQAGCPGGVLVRRAREGEDVDMHAGRIAVADERVAHGDGVVVAVAQVRVLLEPAPGRAAVDVEERPRDGAAPASDVADHEAIVPPERARETG